MIRKAVSPEIELPDKTAIMFLNAKGTHGAATQGTKAFLKYVDDHIATDSFTREIHEEIIHVKNDPAIRRDFMKYEMNLKDVRTEAFEQGVNQAALGMLKAGIAYELIAKATNYSIDKVKEIAKQNQLI